MSPAPRIAVIGGGPAGLMAAETALQQGVRVELFDAMPSVGRKFLLAGKSGLNLTHTEPSEQFLARYGKRRAYIEPLLAAFGPQQLRDWAAALGVATFAGSSGRVFPREMKAAPLLRAWLRRLRQLGLIIHCRHVWRGWDDAGGLRFDTPQGLKLSSSDAVILAMGGGSWAHLGSNGEWTGILEKHGISVEKLRPANCGFDVQWSDHFRLRYAGQPVKPAALSFCGLDGIDRSQPGEFVVTEYGVEGSLIYAQSQFLRDLIQNNGGATIYLDLAPGRDLNTLSGALSLPRGKLSFSNFLQRRAGLKGVKAALLRECLPTDTLGNPGRLAEAIKALPLTLQSPRPIDEAISTAGGVRFEELDEQLMIRSLPGVFCVGEMLDWEAPTGGYLLTACFASGKAAGAAAARWAKS